MTPPVAALKRVRAPNFTAEETIHLCTLVEKYHGIIENRKTDGATLRQKQSAWQELAVEYNSTTKSYARTAENLKACYQNQKSKAKKQHSNAKMQLPGPSFNSDQLVSAVQVYGTDNWSDVALDIGASQDECKDAFKKLAIDAKKDDSSFKKEIMCTGGGPPPKPTNSEVLDRVKLLIGPAIEGMYTMYDGDSMFMQEQQDILPPEKQIAPIDGQITVNESIVTARCSKDPDFEPIFDRSHLKRKRDPLLIVPKDNHSGPEAEAVYSSTPCNTSRRRPQRKTTVTENFMSLAENKIELVDLQKKIATAQLSDEVDKLATNKMLRELEVEEMKNKMDHNKKMREKEETLLDLKIKLAKKQLNDKYYFFRFISHV